MDSSQQNRVYYTWRWGWILLCRTCLLHLEVRLDSFQQNRVYYTWRCGWILLGRTGFTILGSGAGFFSAEQGLLYLEVGPDSSQQKRVYMSVYPLTLWVVPYITHIWPQGFPWKQGCILLRKTGLTILERGAGFFSVEKGLLYLREGLDSSQQNRVYYTWMWGLILLNLTCFTTLGSEAGFFSVEQGLLYLEVWLDSSQQNRVYYTWRWGQILLCRTGY